MARRCGFPEQWTVALRPVRKTKWEQNDLDFTTEFNSTTNALDMTNTHQ